MRMGQIIRNALPVDNDQTDRALFYTKDENMAVLLRNLRISVLGEEAIDDKSVEST